MNLPIVRTTICLLFIFVSAIHSQESRKYQFALPPLEIYDQLLELHSDQSPDFGRTERELLERRWLQANKPSENEKIDSAELLDAMAFASGAVTEQQHAEILTWYQTLAKRVRGDLKSGDAKKLAEALLTTLHQTAMKGGYDLECTSLAEIVADGKFNCVSSTSLYYLLGSDLGLKLQPISIPGSEYQVGHATLDLLVDNDRVQIEPTNADGFEWDVKLAQPGVISLNFGPPRSSGYDVDAWELAGMIYSNRGNKLKSQDQPASSSVVRNYVAALCLSPAAETPNRNLAATFTNWGPELSRVKRLDEAIAIMEFAHRVAPENRDINNNRRVVWIEKIQLLIDEKSDSKAVETIAAAAKAMPEDRDFSSATLWFESAAEKAFQAGTLDDALIVIDRATKVLKSHQDKLIQLRTSLVRRQSQQELQRDDYQASLAVLLRFEPKPDDREMSAGVAYHTQEALRLAYAKGGSKLALQHISDLRKKLPKFVALQEQFENFAQQLIRPTADEGQYDKAFNLVDELVPIFQDEDARQRQLGLVYVLWGEKLEKEKGFEPAYVKLLEGKKACPKCKLLSEHAESCVARWGGDLLDQKKWAEAIKIYELGLKTFPNSSVMKNNIDYCKQELTK